MIDDRTELGTVLLHILEEGMVAPEGLAKLVGTIRQGIALGTGMLAYGLLLLPVEPPEIDALALERTNDIIEERTGKAVILYGPGDGTCVGSRQPHCRTQVLILILGVADAIGGMKIQGCTQAVIMHVVDKIGGIGDLAGIPTPTRPATPVPVHIHDDDIHGDIVVLDIADNTDEIGL